MSEKRKAEDDGSAPAKTVSYLYLTLFCFNDLLKIKPDVDAAFELFASEMGLDVSEPAPAPQAASAPYPLTSMLFSFLFFSIPASSPYFL